MFCKVQNGIVCEYNCVKVCVFRIEKEIFVAFSIIVLSQYSKLDIATSFEDPKKKFPEACVHTKVFA